jgi:glycerol-3-phosphate acyltransferase PlsY
MTTPDPQSLFAVKLFWVQIGTVITTTSYLLGSIPFGLIVAKLHGVDIRKHGSGNIGATNVTRVVGKGAGYTVFALDALKGLVAVLIGSHIAQHYSFLITQTFTSGTGPGLEIRHVITRIWLPESIGSITAAITCIIGHNFPVWLRFKGGKGMATSAGVLIGMLPLVAASCMGIWLIVFLATRYVSLASIAASIALPTSTLLFIAFLGSAHGVRDPHAIPSNDWPYFYFAVAACILAVWRHRENIVRLANGTENRFVPKPKGTTPAPPQQQP